MNVEAYDRFHSHKIQRKHDAQWQTIHSDSFHCVQDVLNDLQRKLNWLWIHTAHISTHRPQKIMTYPHLSKHPWGRPLSAGDWHQSTTKRDPGTTPVCCFYYGAITSAHMKGAHRHRHKHLHTLTHSPDRFGFSPDCSFSALWKPFTTADIHIGPRFSSLLALLLFGFLLSFSLFMLCTLQRWGPRSFEGCCDGPATNPHHPRSSFTAEPRWRARWELFTIPQTPQRSHARSPAHLPAVRGDRTRARCLAWWHAHEHTHTQAHKKGGSRLHPRW